jgi:hypothetical protein
MQCGISNRSSGRERERGGLSLRKAEEEKDGECKKKDSCTVKEPDICSFWAVVKVFTVSTRSIVNK